MKKETKRFVNYTNLVFEKIVPHLGENNLMTVLSGDAIYPHLRLEDYVLQSEEGKLYHFPPVSIGTRLVLRNNDLTVSKPLTIEAYRHPFVIGSKQFECIGMIDSEEIDKLRELEIMQQVTTVLDIGKRRLQNDYGKIKGLRLLRGFEDHLITREDVDRLGLTVTNM
jgi:hypothetical protein